MKSAPPSYKKHLRLERRWNRKLSADCSSFNRHHDRKKVLQEEDRTVVEDEDYMRFLDCLEGYANDGINHYSIRKQVREKEKEGDEYMRDLIGTARKVVQYEAPTQDQVVIRPDQPISLDQTAGEEFSSSKSKPKEISNNDEMMMGKLRCISRSEFREKLMDALRKPYNEKEYEELMYEMSHRKMKQRHKELRGGIKTYSEDCPGKSYLDHHKDLAKMIDSVGCDHHKVLNLMRGFFFWLKNVSHEGAFCPWLDSSCSEVVPILEHDEEVLYLDYHTHKF